MKTLPSSNPFFSRNYVREKGGISGASPFFDMNYEIFPNVHAHVTTPFNFNHAKGEPDGEEPGDDPHTNDGYGDTELGGASHLMQLIF